MDRIRLQKNSIIEENKQLSKQARMASQVSQKQIVREQLQTLLDNHSRA